MNVRLLFVSLMLPLSAPAQVAEQVTIGATAVIAGSASATRLIEACARSQGVPITVRSFGPRFIDSLFAACGLPHARLQFLTRSPSWAAVWMNSARPSPVAAGPVWQGRGITLAGSGGVVGSWRAITYSARPVGFWTQNLAYDPSHTIQVTPNEFRDPWFPGIDRPYRFGDGDYARLDAGESFVRADIGALGLGVSHAEQAWGPARHQQLVLGPHAGGFWHAFVEAARPLNVFLGRVTGRWLIGSLESSGFQSADPAARRRLAVGVVASFVPQGFDGLEFGAARLHHMYDEPGVRTLNTLLVPMRGLLGAGSSGSDQGVTTNQLASLFLRLAPKQSPFEVYGEFLRDDHPADVRDLAVEADHQSAYTLGFRSSSKASTGAVLSVEVTNSRKTHLRRVREQSALYLHNDIVAGHTHRGRTLGSPLVPGGGGITAQWERYAADHSLTLFGNVFRLAQDSEGGTWKGKATGVYRLGATHEWRRRGTLWVLGGVVEPGFGDAPGTNVGLFMKALR